MLETAKKNIEETIDRGAKGIVMPIKFRRLLSAICFEMYKKGLEDGHRICIKTLELSKEQIKKEKKP